jgi:hypothetical protein
MRVSNEGSEPLLKSNSNNGHSTSKSVNYSEPKGGSSFTRSGPGLDGIHESFAYVRLINSAKN